MGWWDSGIVGMGVVSGTVRQWDSETVGTRDWGFGDGVVSGTVRQ